MASEDKTMKLFFRDFAIAFIVSSITINIFKLMELSGTEIVKYITLKFVSCFIISIYIALGRVFANSIYYWLKKNSTNEQNNWCIG